MAPKKPAARGMAQLKKELDEGTVRQLYLLYGTERYLIRQYRDLLLSRLVNEGDSLNFSSYQGASADVQTILGDLSTMPFLSEHRVVLVEDSGFFLKSADELTDALGTLPETGILIFVEPDIEKSTGLTKAVDKRGRLFKLFDKAEGAFSFDVPDEKMLRSWIISRLSDTGKKVEAGVPERLLSAVGTDMSTLDTELEKLISYTLEKEAVSVADVEAISVTVAEDKVFDMVDAISAKKTEQALLLYNDLLTLREPVMKVLYLIAKQYQILVQVAKMQADKTPRSEMAKTAGFLPFLVNKYTTLAGSYTYPQLLAACDACLEADYSIKTGRLSDRNALERLILDLMDLK